MGTLYSPTTSASGSKVTNDGRFHMFEKGVSDDLFDPKKMQPLIRNIILDGNKRKDGSYGRVHVKVDSSASKTPSCTKVVLNVERLH